MITAILRLVFSLIGIFVVVVVLWPQVPPTLSITVRVCDSCRARLTTEQAFAAQIPAELLTPNVVEWMRRMYAIPVRRCA